MQTLPPPELLNQAKEETIIDDAGNPITIRYIGESGKMYEFISAYSDFKKKRLSKDITRKG